MKVRNTAAGVVAAMCLAGCSAHYTDMKWEPIVRKPVQLDMAMANCQMHASSVNQGYFAYGNAGFVAGAALGNAIDNSIRQNNFIINCMTLSGWRGVAKPTKAGPQQDNR